MRLRKRKAERKRNTIAGGYHRVMFYPTPEEAKALRDRAKADDRSQSSIVREAVCRFLFIGEKRKPK